MFCVNSFNVSTTLGQIYYHPHFRDEGTETQRGQLTCPQFIAEYLDSSMTLLYCPRLAGIMICYGLISSIMCLTQQNGNSIYESSLALSTTIIQSPFRGLAYQLVFNTILFEWMDKGMTVGKRNLRRNGTQGRIEDTVNSFHQAEL